MHCAIPEGSTESWLISVAQYEAALSQAEATLLEDGAAFDRFLKESDEKVQQAMRRADTETKAKQEKVRAERLQSRWSNR